MQQINVYKKAQHLNRKLNRGNPLNAIFIIQESKYLNILRKITLLDYNFIHLLYINYRKKGKGSCQTLPEGIDDIWMPSTKTF